MRATNINDISPNLNRGMRWLAKTFSDTLRDPAQDSEDIYQDLIVIFLERKTKLTVKQQSSDGYWYIIFKNYLIDRARAEKLEPTTLKHNLDQNPYEKDA